MYLIRSGAFEGLGRLVRSYGVDFLSLAKELGLTPPQFRDPTSYIPYPKMAELLEVCSVECNTQLLGLMLSPRQGLGVLGDLVATISQEPTVSDAIKKLDHYLYLHASGIHVIQSPRGSNVQIEVKFDFNTRLGTNQLIQFSVGRMINLIGTLIKGDPYRFGIFLQQSVADEMTIPNKLPFSKIQFSGPFDGMLVSSKALLQKPNVDANALQAYFNEYLRDLKERYPDSLQNQVVGLISRLLPTSDYGIQIIASSLNLHPRNLQRKLRQEGTTYGKLLQETRMAIAQQYLKNGKISITDISLNLGYADLSVFSRNFKNFTGMSPSQWQKACG